MGYIVLARYLKGKEAYMYKVKDGRGNTFDMSSKEAEDLYRRGYIKGVHYRRNYGLVADTGLSIKTIRERR